MASRTIREAATLDSSVTWFTMRGIPSIGPEGGPCAHGAGGIFLTLAVYA
ncbi:MAG: hypothetical protein ACREQI_15425 [Candidatus Binataceae bacterium]